MNKWRFMAWGFNLIAIGAFLIPIKKKIELIENSGLAEIHALLYFFLFLVFWKANYPKKAIFIVLALQGIGIEYIQPFVNRGFSYFDMMGNCTGLAIAYGVSLFLSRRSTAPAKKVLEKL